MINILNPASYEYWIIGLLVCLLNGGIRKMEADALLGFIWIICWWMTPIALIARLISYIYNSLKAYQPLRRIRIFILRKF